ncbi:MAG: LemA family protein [Myxococcota bacterium]
MSQPPPSPRSPRSPRSIDYEDVDDIIGVAAELQQLDADRLSVEELVDVGRELAIPEQFVGPAIAELRRRRDAKLAVAAAAARRRRYALIGAGALVGLAFLAALVGQRSLAGAYAEVARARAQLVNVQERQEGTRKLWEASSNARERMAELSGADNRVRVERQRYDEAAAAYNASAGAFPNRLWAGLFGYPTSVPTSDALGAE